MVSPANDTQTPTSMPNIVSPQDIAGAGQTRLIVDAVKETVAELKADVREIKGHRWSDLLWHIGSFAAGFVLLAGMMLAAYFKLEDRLFTLSTSATRVETKLEDLLQRIPPVQTPAPRR